MRLDVPGLAQRGPIIRRGRVFVGSVPLDPLTSDETVDHVMTSVARGRGGMLLTPNVNIARQVTNPRLHGIVAAADLSVCDGAPLLWASRLAGTPVPARVTGADLIFCLSAAAALAQRSVFVLGGRPGVADDAAAELSRRFPGLVVSGTACPPVGFAEDDSAVTLLLDAVARARPHIVFVCLGFPLQEQVAIALRRRLPASWSVACGAAVDFAAGTRSRAPRRVQQAGLEWAYRLAQEPRRLGPRYARDALYATTLLFRAAVAGIRRRRTASRTRVPSRLLPPESAGQVHENA